MKCSKSDFKKIDQGFFDQKLFLCYIGMNKTNFNNIAKKRSENTINVVDQSMVVSQS